MVDEEKDFNEEEVTSTEDGHSDENETEEGGEEETLDYWKQRAEKAESDRDNYKEGLLSVKKKRDLSVDRPEKNQVDVSEDKVVSVLDKRNERAALEDVVNPKSDAYIPELVDDAQYNQIIGYLPRNLDKSSPQKIVRALKVATKLWQEDHGLTEAPKAKDKSGELATMSTKPSGEVAEGEKQKRTILKKHQSIDQWY